MSTKKTAKQPVRQYESIAGKDSRIKTEIITTDPKTIITIIGKLPESVNQELRFVVDSFLKGEGF